MPSSSVVPSSSAASITRVSSGGGVVKLKAKDSKGKGKAKLNRDLRSEYFVNFVREKKAKEARDAAERAEREKAGGGDGSSHPVSGGSIG